MNRNADTGLYTIQNSHSNTKNRFLAANLEIHGSPIIGRGDSYSWSLQGFNHGLQFLCVYSTNVLDHKTYSENSIGKLLHTEQLSLSIGLPDYEIEEYDEVRYGIFPSANLDDITGSTREE